MKKLLHLFVLTLTPLFANAYDMAVKNADGVTIYYNYVNDGSELAVAHCGYSDVNYSGNVVIPEEVIYMNRTRKVTGIDKRAFNYCTGLTSIVIGNSVTSIGEYAFSNCVNLTSVVFGNNVTSIGQMAFQQCNSLKKVIVSDIAAWCGISFGNNEANPLHYAKHLYHDENTEITNLVIPDSVTSIGSLAFRFCASLISIVIGNSVTSIGSNAFSFCSNLSSVKIPNSVTTIGDYAFRCCNGLTSITIPNSVTSIGNYAFCDCSCLTSITIPNSVITIGEAAFAGCSGLTSITIPNSVTSIDNYAFEGCSGLTSVAIGSGVMSIGKHAFDFCDIPIVISLIENPFKIIGKTSNDKTFSLNTFNNASLYVPKGTIDKYKATEGWKDFVFIEESDTPPTPPTPESCKKPTIGYRNGNLMFTSATEGATCYYSITDTDIKAGNGNEVQLTATYNISVYAAKEGFENSETATATLCWIDDVPQMEGITNSLTRIAARPILVRTDNGFVTVEGIDDRTDVSVFAADGKLAGTAVSHNNIATIATSIQSGSIAIVKVGEKSIKVVMK